MTRQPRAPRVKWIVGIAALALAGLVVYSTWEQTRHRVEVCVTFRGHSHCATASGRTQQEAVASAQAIGCALLASGRDENIVCLATPPASVKPLP